MRILDRSFPLRQCAGWLGSVLVFLVLGAHFYRSSEYGLVLCTAGVLLFHCSSAPWKRCSAALFLLCGMLEWLHTASVLAQVRIMMDMPWIRGTAILTAVSFVTGLTGAICFRKASFLAEQRNDKDAPLKAVVFIAVFVLLFLLRSFVPLNLLILERLFGELGSIQIFLAAWYGAFAAGILADPQRCRRLRIRLWLIFGAAFFMQFGLGLLGMDEMFLTGRLHAPIPAFILYGPLFRESVSAMPFIVLVSVLFLGSAWCSMLCYFGPFDALASQGRTVRAVPAWLASLLRCGRPAILVSGLALTWGLREAGLSVCGTVSLSLAYALLSLMIMAGLSRRYGGMLHCTTFCPMGLVVSLLGRLSPWRIRIDQKRCSGCGGCEKICRWRAITPESRAEGGTLLRCSLCRDCLSLCPHGAISLHCAGLPPAFAHRLFSGLLAVFHAVFLSVAMV